jgi:hypothetical protein
MEACLIIDLKLEWEEVSACCSSELNGRSLVALLCKLSFAAIVYHLWRHINDLLHGNSLRLWRM